jgi:SOS response associated peptidase (SRAP)
MDIEIDGHRYRISLGPGSFDDGEFVRFDRQTRTVEVNQSLSPQLRMSLVKGLLLNESHRDSYQRSCIGLMVPGVDEALREALGAPIRRGTQAYKLIATPMELDTHFGVSPQFAVPRCVEPGDVGLFIRIDGDGPGPALAQWGVDDESTVFTTNPGDEFWSTNVQTGRCLVPATGWFHLEPSKSAMYLLASAKLFAFAGVWGRVAAAEGETRLVFTILTTDPDHAAAGGPDSMPVVLAPDEYGLWLEQTDGLPNLIDQVRRPWPKSDLIQMTL